MRCHIRSCVFRRAVSLLRYGGEYVRVRNDGGVLKMTSRAGRFSVEVAVRCEVGVFDYTVRRGDLSRVAVSTIDEVLIFPKSGYLIFESCGRRRILLDVGCVGYVMGRHPADMCQVQVLDVRGFLHKVNEAFARFSLRESWGVVTLWGSGDGRFVLFDEEANVCENVDVFSVRRVPGAVRCSQFLFLRGVSLLSEVRRLTIEYNRQDGIFLSSVLDDIEVRINIEGDADEY